MTCQLASNRVRRVVGSDLPTFLQPGGLELGVNCRASDTATEMERK